MALPKVDLGVDPTGAGGDTRRMGWQKYNEAMTELDGVVGSLPTIVEEVEALKEEVEAELATIPTLVDTAIAGRIPGKNRFINGDFRVWQRASSLPAATGARFAADRWFLGAAGSTVAANRLPVPTYGGQALADLGSNASFMLEAIVASVAGAANNVYMQQRVEDVRTLAGKTVTISFKARSTLPEFKVGAELSQVFGTGGSAQINGARGSITITSAWATHKITLPVPSVAAATIGENSALQFTLWLDAGANVADRASNIGQKSGTVYITDIQMEEGGTATGFEWRPFAEELALCQRYYEKSYDLSIPPGTAGSLAGQNTWFLFGVVTGNYSCGLTSTFKVSKRTVPAVTIYSPNTGAPGKAASAAPATDVNASVDNPGHNGMFVTIASTNTNNINMRWHWAADAEL